MTEKIAVIINGKHKKHCKKINGLINSLSDVYAVKTFTTARPLEAIDFIKNQIDADTKIIIAVGGDGTINEVTNGILLSGKKLVFGFVPCGSSNDFSKTLRSDDLISAIKSRSTKKIDAGKISFTDKNGKKQNRYFLNIAEIGLGAETVRITKRFFISSKITFTINSIRTMMNFKYNNVKIKTSEGFEFSGETTAVVFANGKFFGNGLGISPRSVLDDGFLNLVLVKKISMLNFVRALPRLRKSEILTDLGVIYEKFRSLEVLPLDKHPYPLEADGEFLGYLPAKIEVIPGAMEILV